MKKALFVSSFLLLMLAVLGRLLRFRARQPRTLDEYERILPVTIGGHHHIWATTVAQPEIPYNWTCWMGV